MSKLPPSPPPAVAYPQLGDIVSKAHRYSDYEDYRKAVDAYMDGPGNPSPIAYNETSCSFELPGYKELLFVWQSDPKYPTDCDIDYELIAGKNLIEFTCSYYWYLLKYKYEAVEVPGKGFPGANDSKNGTERAVMRKDGQLKGVVINPPYPFVPLVAGLGRRMPTYRGYLALLVGGIGIGLAIGAIGRLLARPR